MTAPIDTAERSRLDKLITAALDDLGLTYEHTGHRLRSWSRWRASTSCGP